MKTSFNIKIVLLSIYFKSGAEYVMEKFFDNYSLEIGVAADSPFMNKYNVYQDGTAPMYRDVNGTLWAMSGHTHMGNISVFSGSCLDDMKKCYDINTNFATGRAGEAFNGICYPDGMQSRGSVWPFGLYICPVTHRFFCWFHNETGWNGQGTAYDAFGICQQPKYDSDFRHVGLMHSDDEGRNWTFDRWVLTGYEISVTDKYNPGAGNVIGQNTAEPVRFGCGDFCLFIPPDEDFIYLFYDILTMDLNESDPVKVMIGCDACVARCRKRSDGTMGDFVKYYEGSFCEAGNLGRETPVLADAWHPRVVYSEVEKMYIMTSKPIIACHHRKYPGIAPIGGKIMQISISADLINWSEPEVVYINGAVWGNHYNAIVPDDKISNPGVLKSNTFSILNNGNGSDVMRYPVKLIRK